VCLFTVGTVIDHIPQVDPEDAGLPPEQRPWRFAGQTTVCRTSTCNDHAAGDRPTYLQLWQSRNGEWASRASRPAALFNWQTQKRSLARSLAQVTQNTPRDTFLTRFWLRLGLECGL
jgi:hypothetical protein